MRTIVISITVPDGVEVRVSNGTTLDDFEHEPLPLETYSAAEEPFQQRQVAQNGVVAVAVPPVVRTMATEQPQAVLWQEGQVHQQGHKPLKAGRYGLYCPTSVGKDQEGKTVFCQWRP